jgi:hypothetical protein
VSVNRIDLSTKTSLLIETIAPQLRPRDRLHLESFIEPMYIRDIIDMVSLVVK